MSEFNEELAKEMEEEFKSDLDAEDTGVEEEQIGEYGEDDIPGSGDPEDDDDLDDEDWDEDYDEDAEEYDGLDPEDDN